jgi:hypothetical protein
VSAVVTRIPVTGDRPYDVLVGSDLTGELPALIGGAAQAAVLYAAPLRERAELIAASCSGSRSPSTASRIAVTRRTACSRARWQIEETGTPESRTASARSSGRYTLIFGKALL